MSAFVVRTVGEVLPHRDRRGVRAWATYEAEDGFTCFITMGAAKELVRQLESHPDTEWMGLLSGRVLSDSAGVYAVVSGVAGAVDIAATAGHVACGTAEYGRLVKQLAAIDPSGDHLGWWHTHLGPGGYSGTDLREQATWTNSNSIGLLARPGSPPGAGGVYLYRGPRAERLRLIDEQPLVRAGRRRAASLDPGRRGAALAPISGGAASADGAPEGVDDVRFKRAVLAAIATACILALAALALAGAAFARTNDAQTTLGIPAGELAGSSVDATSTPPMGAGSAAPSNGAAAASLSAGVCVLDADVAGPNRVVQPLVERGP